MAGGKKKKTSARRDLLLVLLTVVPFIAIVSVAISYFSGGGCGPAETTGTVRSEGGSLGTWSQTIDTCVIRNDVTPSGFVRGKSSAYTSRVFSDSSEVKVRALCVVRDVKHNIFGDKSLTIKRGPNESPSPQDLRELAKLDREGWSILLLDPKSKKPVRVDPKRCSRFAIDVAVTASRSGAQDNSGTLALTCRLPGGGRINAQVRYSGCI